MASITLPSATYNPRHSLPPSYDLFTESQSAPSTFVGELPSYGKERRTLPERCFWIGFFCFPVWAVGAALYFSSSDPIKAARAKSADAPPMTIKSWMRSIAERKAQQPDVEGLSVSEEMRLSWRAEEKRWALLCLRFLAVALLLTSLAVFVVLYFFVLNRQ